jgi:hypothetical protein
MVENSVLLGYEAASLGNQFRDILKEQSIFAFMGLEVQRELKALYSFKTPGTYYPMMQLHIQEQKLVHKFENNFKAIPILLIMT